MQYLYDGRQAIAEIRGSAISATLLTGLAIDEAIARYTDQGERTHLTDALGSVIVSAKEDGSVATAYGYSPYGETQVMGTEEGNATQYTGRENDGTGLFYYRARYYDAALKQWLSEDPIGIDGGINNRTYVGGNPVSIIDPMGLDNPGMGPYDPPKVDPPCDGPTIPKGKANFGAGGTASAFGPFFLGGTATSTVGMGGSSYYVGGGVGVGQFAARYATQWSGTWGDATGWGARANVSGAAFDGAGSFSIYATTTGINITVGVGNGAGGTGNLTFGYRGTGNIFTSKGP